MAHASQGAAGGGAARAGARPACAGPASLSRAVRVRRAVSRHAGEIGRVQGGWALLGLALRLWAAWVRRDKQQAPGLLPWTPALAFVPAPALALCLLGLAARAGRLSAGFGGSRRIGRFRRRAGPRPGADGSIKPMWVSFSRPFSVSPCEPGRAPRSHALQRGFSPRSNGAFFFFLKRCVSL